ncbi:MAG: hypothetical protein SYR96_24870 [Actinomycetota bacterium]|nr:hypothetical protein [Actinomycetota bacterium]
MTARIGRASVTLSGEIDPATAREAAEQAFTDLARSGATGRARIGRLEVDVRVPHHDVGRLAEVIGTAVAAAVRRETER